MRNIIKFMILIVFISSCTTPQQDNTAFDLGLSKFEKNKAIADKTFDLFIDKDLDGMMNMYSDDVIWSPANTLDSLSKADLRGGMAGWMENFESFCR